LAGNLNSIENMFYALNFFKSQGWLERKIGVD
jgi:hypothetical protein